MRNEAQITTWTARERGVIALNETYDLRTSDGDVTIVSGALGPSSVVTSIGFRDELTVYTAPHGGDVHGGSTTHAPGVELLVTNLLACAVCGWREPYATEAQYHAATNCAHCNWSL